MISKQILRSRLAAAPLMAAVPAVLVLALEAGKPGTGFPAPEPKNQGIADANTVPIQFINVPRPDREEAAL